MSTYEVTSRNNRTPAVALTSPLPGKPVFRLFNSLPLDILLRVRATPRFELKFGQKAHREENPELHEDVGCHEILQVVLQPRVALLSHGGRVRKHPKIVYVHN